MANSRHDGLPLPAGVRDGKSFIVWADGSRKGSRVSADDLARLREEAAAGAAQPASAGGSGETEADESGTASPEGGLSPEEEALLAEEDKETDQTLDEIAKILGEEPAAASSEPKSEDSGEAEAESEPEPEPETEGETEPEPPAPVSAKPAEPVDIPAFLRRQGNEPSAAPSDEPPADSSDSGDDAADVDDGLADMEAVMAGEGDATTKDSRLRRFTRWARENRTAVFVLVILVLVAFDLAMNYWRGGENDENVLREESPSFVAPRVPPVVSPDEGHREAARDAAIMTDQEPAAPAPVTPPKPKAKPKPPEKKAATVTPPPMRPRKKPASAKGSGEAKPKPQASKPLVRPMPPKPVEEHLAPPPVALSPSIWRKVGEAYGCDLVERVALVEGASETLRARRCGGRVTGFNPATVCPRFPGWGNRQFFRRVEFGGEESLACYTRRFNPPRWLLVK